MNVVKLKINPYQNTNSIRINDKPLSPSSTLNSLEKRPFLEWAYIFFEIVEEAIGDEFKLIVTAGEFENILLSHLKTAHSRCTEYIYEPFEVDESDEIRLNTLETLGKKYLADYKKFEDNILICDEAIRKIALPMRYTTTFEEKQADVIMVNNEPESVDLAKKQDGKFIIYLDEPIQARRVGKSYVLGLTDSEAYKFLETVVQRKLYTPRIIALHHDLQQEAENLSAEELKLLARAIAIDSDAMSDGEVAATEVEEEVEAIEEVEEIAPMPLGEMVMGVDKTQKVDFEKYAIDEEDVTKIEVISDDPKVAVILDEGRIRTISEGTCTITLKGEHTQATITLIVRPQIKTITLSQSQWRAVVGEVKPIEVTVEPSDAYNTEYRWYTTDGSVATVASQKDGSQFLWARGVGSCMLTCQAVEGAATTSIAVVVDAQVEKKEGSHIWLILCTISCIAYFICYVMQAQVGIILSAILTWILGMVTIITRKADWIWALILMALPVVALLLI